MVAPSLSPRAGIRYGSVCSGIEAATSAWHPLGWTPAWFSEIGPFPCAVLAHHYPDVPNLGDMTKITESDLDHTGSIDLLVGGTPCQSFSVAGLRKGMADPRGNLALEFLRLLDRTRARWVVWENVPGVLSSAGGRDFGAFLGALGELGYGWSYRVLDAQYFGVAQRRRRVFVVGHLGGWRRAASVLLESASLRGDPAPRREAGAGSASVAACGFEVGGTLGSRVSKLPLDECVNGSAIVFDAVQVTSDKNYSSPKPGDPCHPLAAHNAHGACVAFPAAFSNQGMEEEMSPTIHTAPMAVGGGGVDVRKFTPRECERLQGFHDDYTLVPYRGKPAKDGPRYMALGNSMAVPVMAWIGERIAAVEGIA